MLLKLSSHIKSVSENEKFEEATPLSAKNLPVTLDNPVHSVKFSLEHWNFLPKKIVSMRTFDSVSCGLSRVTD